MNASTQTPLHTNKRQRVAVIGGGWAGMAAAVSLVEQGHDVAVWEMARQWGGRARALPLRDLQGKPLTLDNGQHILIGAYSECLRMMRTVGVDPDTALLRLPLDLRYADGQGLCLPHCAPPWDAVLGIFRAQGWSLRDKLALLNRAARWKLRQFHYAPNATVAELCKGLPVRLMHDFIDPLCISALNLPAHSASGSVFLRILQDALFAGEGGSNLLIPKVDLGTLFPATAATWLAQHGAQLHLGTRVQTLERQKIGAIHSWSVDGQPFDAVILATSSLEAARLVELAAPSIELPSQHKLIDWATTAKCLPHTSIATVYAQHTSNKLHLARPLVALRSSEQAPAQFAFERAQLDGSAGVMAFVVSASDTLPFQDRAALENAVLIQAQSQLALPALRVLRSVVEKRATFACAPCVRRPESHISTGLWACGDYIAGPYPATLEGAVRSGKIAAEGNTSDCF